MLAQTLGERITILALLHTVAHLPCCRAARVALLSLVEVAAHVILHAPQVGPVTPSSKGSVPVLRQKRVEPGEINVDLPDI